MIIRPAIAQDADALGRMGAALAAQHHAFDAQRFMLPEGVELGYRHWLSQEAQKPEAVVCVAEHDGRVVGYAYGRLEERDWNALRDRCGVLHDIWVDAEARRLGTGRQLTEAVAGRLEALGAPRVVLSTAAKNGSAQAFFERLGWRRTMVEFTRETKT